MSIWLRLVEPAVMATVKMASISAGSAMAAMVISRLLPMPPNALAGSSPPSARKKRPSASNPTNASAPPNRLNGALHAHQRHHQARQQRGNEQHIRHGPEDPRGMFGDHHVLAQEFGQVEIRLPDARAAAVLQLGLPVPDAAADQTAPAPAAARVWREWRGRRFITQTSAAAAA